jgi:hypothetical protein
MTKIEIEHRIVQETRDLPMEFLREVLDFVEFLKVKYAKTSLPIAKEEQVNEPPAETLDVLRLLPKHQLGKVNSSLRREEIYTDAR